MPRKTVRKRKKKRKVANQPSKGRRTYGSHKGSQRQPAPKKLPRKLKGKATPRKSPTKYIKTEDGSFVPESFYGTKKIPAGVRRYRKAGRKYMIIPLRKKKR